MTSVQDVLESSSVRFDVSNLGWKRLNAGRKASDLIREAVSNTFDADLVTEVRVKLDAGFVSIEDNAPNGISDVSLVTTIFLTDKQDSATKRGRKGRGLKELISAADWAEVDTIGFKTTFTDGRSTVKSSRTSGTKVSVRVPEWEQKQIDDAVVYLSKIIPPSGVKFYINDVLVSSKRLRQSISAHLRTQTVIDGIQKDSYRYTDIEVYNLAKGERVGWIYEMGIPIQESTTRFHVNICQRVPLNDNRDTVDYYYMCTVARYLLEGMLPQMSAGALGHQWVDQGLDGLSTDASKTLVRKLFGNPDMLAVISDDTRANDVARQHAYKVIDLTGLTSNLAYLLRRIIPTVNTVVSKIEEETGEEVVAEQIADPAGSIRRLVRFLGNELLGRSITPEYFKKPPSFTGFTKQAHFRNDQSIIGFNVACNKLHKPLSSEIFSVIVHEFAHSVSNTHDVIFHEEVQKLAGKLAVTMLLKGDKLVLDLIRKI